MTTNPLLVEELRGVSRAMVRSLGFMGGTFAGTDLPPSAVHALIEIERGHATARDLGQRLRLEKSSVSRMLAKLVASGDVVVSAAETDGRLRQLSLSEAGQRRVAAIHAFARAQVTGAMGRLAPGQDRTVLEGMRLYAAALEPGSSQEAAAGIDIRTGYESGLIARITQMHALFYTRESGFGQRFESVVARGLADFCERLQHPGNAIWSAHQGDRCVGSVAIDGQDLAPGIAHLRWFIVDDGLRGAGVGRRLLEAALAFADAQGFEETQLWTFSGLTAARRLYETHGFRCVEEWTGDQWGKTVQEQRFVRRRP